MQPLLLIDAGNSCVKWQFHHSLAEPNAQSIGQSIAQSISQSISQSINQSTGRIENELATAEQLALLWQPLIKPQGQVQGNLKQNSNQNSNQNSCADDLSMAWLSVGPQHVQQAIMSAFRLLTGRNAPPPYRLDHGAAAAHVKGNTNCIIRNRYQEPSQLGVDRWVSAIGWAVSGQGKAGKHYFVISAGTATTIDLLHCVSNTEIIFEGGWILPGAGLMHQSLLQQTRDLHYPLGSTNFVFDIAPTDSACAITHGIGLAQAGFMSHLANRYGVQEIMLHGGNAKFWNSVFGQLFAKEDQTLLVTLTPDLTFAGLKAIATGAVSGAIFGAIKGPVTPLD